MCPTERNHQPSSAGPAPDRSVQPTVVRYVACYALYFLILAACYLNFVLWNNAVQLAAVAILGRQMSLEAAYALTMLLVIGALFFTAISAEHSLRTSVPRGELRSAFSRIAVRLLVAALVAVVIATVVDRLVL